MQYPNNRELIQLFISSFGNDSSFKLLEYGIVVHFYYGSVEYYAYLKCVSYAGKPYPLNVTRAQLPKRKEFKSIKKSNARFLFLGYDILNHVFVCWDPNKVKSRLNKKKYVSFFSRKNSQENVKPGEVVTNNLSNGDIFAIFNKEDLGLFLQTIDSYFSLDDTLDSSTVQMQKNDVNNDDLNAGGSGNVDKDTDIIKLIDQLWSSGANRLAIIARCMNDYASRYPQMSFSSWKTLICTYIDSKEIEDGADDLEHQEETKDNHDSQQMDVSNQGYKLFYINSKGLVACGAVTSDTFIVFKGSELSPSNSKSYTKARERNRLLSENAIYKYDKYVLLNDLTFNNPSAAACFCLGRSANGWIEWKDKNGKDLDTHFRKQNNSDEHEQNNKRQGAHSITDDYERSHSLQEPQVPYIKTETGKKPLRTVTYIIDDTPKDQKNDKNNLNPNPPEKKHTIASSDSEIDKFIAEFTRMRASTKDGVKSPHKAVLLITILKLIGLRIYTTNHIAFDDLLIIEFGRYWDKLVSKDSPFNKNICHPFIHLSSDSFFHLNLKKRITDINANWHIDTIREVCNYAFIDNDLFALAQVEESRMKLINFLIDYFGLNNLSSSKSSSSLRSVTTIYQRKIEPIKRAPIKTYGNDVRCTPESFAQYLSGVKNIHGRPFSKSSIGVYVGATKGEYMREVLSRFSETDNLYAITDINTLKRILDYIENDDFKSNSKTPLFALRLYIRYIEDLPTSNTRESVKYWIKSNNVQDFRLDDWMQNHDEVPWRRTNILEVGDIVFMYTSLPVQRLTYVFRVEKLDVTPPAEMSFYWGDKRKASMPIQHDLLKLIQRIPSDRKLSLLDLQLHGAYGRLQGGRIISGELLEYILGEIAKSDSTTITPAKTISQAELQQSSHVKKETRQYWLFSWNEKKFLLHDFFRRYQYIDWNNKHNNHLCIGDIVFLYCSQPESTIRYVAEVTEINVPVSESIDDSAYSLTPPMPVTYKYCTRLKLIKRVRSPKLDFHKLERYGLNGSIQSPRKPNKQLLNYILSVIGDIE